MTFQRVLIRLFRTLGNITVGSFLLFYQRPNILTFKIPTEILEVSSALSSYQSSIPPWSILSSIRKSFKSKSVLCWEMDGDVTWDVCVLVWLDNDWAGYLFIISVRHTLTNADKLPPVLPHHQPLKHFGINLL